MPSGQNCEDTPVATRSAGPVGYPGQFETYLHVKGTDDVVLECYPCLGKHNQYPSIIARARLGLPIDTTPLDACELYTMVDG